MQKPRFPAGVHLVGGRNAAATHRRSAAEFYAPLLAVVAGLRRQGLSLRAIAGELDRRGVKTRQGWDRWSATQVRRVLARAAERRAPQEAPPAADPPDRPTIHFSCPHCGRPFEAPPAYAGRPMRCPVCGRDFRVPDADPSPATR